MGTDPRPITEELPPAVDSVPRARRVALDYAASVMEAEQLHNLALVVTEVVSNAVRHANAREDVRLAMTPKDGFLCVQVTDSGHGLIPRPGAMTTPQGAGYGLFLVEHLTRRWGMTRERGRTRVWFEIDCGAERAAAGAM